MLFSVVVCLRGLYHSQPWRTPPPPSRENTKRKWLRDIRHPIDKLGPEAWSGLIPAAAAAIIRMESGLAWFYFPW